MDNDNGAVRSVAWSELFPWLLLVRCFRISTSPRMLLPSALGVILTVLGWSLLAGVFLDASKTPGGDAAARPCPWTATMSLVPNRLESPFGSPEAQTQSIVGPIVGPWRELSTPLRSIFPTGMSQQGTGRISFTHLAFYVLCGLWGLAVWALLGGAVTRGAALQLAAGERMGLVPMLKFGISKWRAFFTAPLLPLIAVLVIAILLAILGFFLRLNIAWPIAAVLWPLVLLAGLAMAMLLLGLAFGWPLMFATVGVEGTDSFDALSRAYAYVYQRPLHLIFYTIIALFFGVLGWIVVSYFAAATIALSCWGVEWGTGDGRFLIEDGLLTFRFADNESLSHVGWLGGQVVFFWAGCVKLLAVGYLYSYFWTASTAVYYLLRHDIDATELDEVLLESHADEPCGALPPLKVDEQGATVVAKPNSEDSPAEPE